MPNSQTLRKNFTACQRLVAMYLTSLGSMLARASSFPRILRLVPEKSNWQIGEIIPASPEYLAGGMDSVRQMLRDGIPGEPYTLNLFMLAIRKSRESSQIAFLVLAGDASGERALFGGVPGSDWREVDESMLPAFQNDEEDAPYYRPTAHRIQQCLSRAIPTGVLTPEALASLAEECLGEALQLTSAAVTEALDEVHSGVIANLDSTHSRMDDLQAAVIRAVKSKDSQYNRLFSDYQKVQLQAQGFQKRIKQLEAELKKLGQCKVKPGASGIDGDTLASRLDSLF